MKKYVGGEFILQSDDTALYIAINDSRTQTSEVFTWQELEAEGICRHPSGECEWIYDSFDDMYDTKCGEGFFLEAGSVEENNMKFCPFCGNKVKTIYEKDLEEVEE